MPIGRQEWGSYDTTLSMICMNPLRFSTFGMTVPVLYSRAVGAPFQPEHCSTVHDARWCGTSWTFFMGANSHSIGRRTQRSKRNNFDSSMSVRYIYNREEGPRVSARAVTGASILSIRTNGSRSCAANQNVKSQRKNIACLAQWSKRGTQCDKKVFSPLSLVDLCDMLPFNVAKHRILFLYGLNHQ